MARTVKYTKEDFYTYIEKQIAEGRRFKEITPKELQDNVGAAYSRCSEILAEAQTDFEETETEVVPSMPVWFRDFVSQLADQTRQAAESQWLKVGRGIAQSVEDATAVFEDRRAEFEKVIAEQLDQIRELEIKSENLEDESINRKAQLEAANSELNTSKDKIRDLSGELSVLKERRAMLADELSDRKSEHKLDQEELVKVRKERDMLQGQLLALQEKK